MMDGLKKKMDFNTVRSAIIENQYFRELTPQTQGLLLRDANLRTAEKGYIIYQEGESLNDTFCLLLEGELVVKKSGAEVGMVEPWELFGSRRISRSCRPVPRASWWRRVRRSGSSGRLLRKISRMRCFRT